MYENILGASKKGSEKAEAGGLKRNIGLMAAVNVIISVMIGSGIFVSPTAALKYSGSIGLCLIVWTACGVISLMGKLKKKRFRITTKQKFYF